MPREGAREITGDGDGRRRWSRRRWALGAILHVLASAPKSGSGSERGAGRRRRWDSGAILDGLASVPRCAYASGRRATAMGNGDGRPRWILSLVMGLTGAAGA